MSEQNSNSRSTADKLIAQRATKEAQEQNILENKEAYAKALNVMAQTKNGELVLKTLIKALEVFSPKSGRDGVALIEVNTKRNFYLEFIRPYLEPHNRHNLEG